MMMQKANIPLKKKGGYKSILFGYVDKSLIFGPAMGLATSFLRTIYCRDQEERAFLVNG